MGWLIRVTILYRYRTRLRFFGASVRQKLVDGQTCISSYVKNLFTGLADSKKVSFFQFFYNLGFKLAKFSKRVDR